jgi:ribosomal protein L7/L12
MEYQELLRVAITMRQEGAATDVWLRALRDDGATIIDSVKVVREVLGVSLAEAKPIVDESPVWSDVRESNRVLREQVERMIDEDRILDI